VFGCPEARWKSCWKGCSLADHKYSVSLPFPARHLKDQGEEKMAETSGEIRTTTSAAIAHENYDI